MNNYKKIGFFLLPGQKASKEIQDKKNYFNSFSNKQNFLNDFPHLTLFHGKYESFKTSDIKLINSINLLNTLKETNYIVSEKHIFENDIKEEFSTLVYLLNENRLIQNIQLQILRKLKPNVASDFTNLNKQYLNNLNSYNYPFAGEDLIPHFTVSNIEKLSPIEKNKFLSNDIYIEERFSQFVVGEIIEEEIKIIEELW